jgi:CDP-2,3-bis-(O-geranylgeranyl)-sn-glycerol synthase
VSLASEVFALLYFFVPAYIANMSAVYARKYDVLNVPLDFGLYIKQDCVFGKNKTWRGLLFGVLAGEITFLIQLLLSRMDVFPALFSYSQLPILLGALIGLGALLGDAVESFVKRRLRIGPGQKLVIWDQIDFVLGAGLVTLTLWYQYWLAFIISLAIILVVTVLIQRIAFMIGIKDDPL